VQKSSMSLIRRARLFVGAPGWIFAGLVVLYIAGLWMPWPSPVLDVLALVGFPLALVTLVWLAVAIVASFFIYRLACPLCGESFFESDEPPFGLKPPFTVMFITKCGHCGLSIRSPVLAQPNNSLQRP
jgi:hypothetical protein